MADLVTVTDIEAQGGYSYEDFKQAGARMDASKFTTLVENLIEAATSATLTYCGRTSWVEATVTEYHNGKGQATEKALIYMLREAPFISLTSLHVDTSDFTAAENWVERTVRSSEAAGDFALLRRPRYVMIRFHNNAPEIRDSNIKIIYKAGYQITDPEYADIKQIIIQIVRNNLDYIKHQQESYAANNARIATQDAATMIPITDKRIFSESIERRLKPYKRKSWGSAYK